MSDDDQGAQASETSDQGQVDGQTSPFDTIRQVDADGNEWWSARELAETLGYIRWQQFLGFSRRPRSPAKPVAMRPQIIFKMSRI